MQTIPSQYFVPILFTKNNLFVWTVTLQAIPFCCGIFRIHRKLQFYNIPIAFLQLSHIFHIILHQFSQGGKLLSPIEIIKVTCVLYLDMGHFPFPPVKIKETHQFFITSSLKLYKFNKRIILLWIFPFVERTREAMFNCMVFYATFNSISVISRKQLTLFLSFLGFTSTRLTCLANHAATKNP